MTTAPRPDTPPSRRVAVVGAGPSGLFAAQALLAGDGGVLVDVFDRLPTPYGLVRYGVAPDHTSIKATTKVFERVLADARVTFYGMLEFGRDLGRDEVLAAYDAVVYAVGASEDARLGIPGEDLVGSRSAREFVAWYSGHPDAQPQSLAGVGSVVAFGVGNVALDVARILLHDRDHLSTTDMPETVLNELRAARVADVWVVGRRGPQHASFTTTELRELLCLDGVQPIISGAELDDVDPEGLDRRTRGNLAALREAADRVVDDPRARLHLAFWRRPVEFVGHGRLGAVVLERTVPDGATTVRGTGQLSVVRADLALRAIGYRAVPLPGVPFDADRGVIRNVEGRVVDADGAVHPREYVVGWIKRGPVGVIGTNKSDAAETVRHLLADLDGAPPHGAAPGIGAVLAARGITASSFDDWQRIDEAEMALGATRHRQRTKVETWFGLVDLVRSGREGGSSDAE